MQVQQTLFMYQIAQCSIKNYHSAGQKALTQDAGTLLGGKEKLRMLLESAFG